MSGSLILVYRVVDEGHFGRKRLFLQDYCEVLQAKK
tara:strand:+ start:426 stop:533 length:108 start_codon:yes stop_codon:yes gene_type:complete